MTNNAEQETDTGGKQSEPDVDKYLKAYQQVWSIYQTNNDNYFKRTQILMFAIQIAVFAAIVKLIGDIGDNSILPKSELGQAALWVIPLLGFLSALAWATLITRQWSILELYRRYMRYLERVLMTEHGVPLAPFTLETAVFIEQKCIEFDSGEGDHDQETGDNGKEYFPDCGARGQMRIKMMRIEECMAVFLMSFWFACLVTLLWYTVDNSPRCFWFAFIFGGFWILAFAFGYWGYKYLKNHWGRRCKATKKFSEFMKNG